MNTNSSAPGQPTSSHFPSGDHARPLRFVVPVKSARLGNRSVSPSTSRTVVPTTSANRCEPGAKAALETTGLQPANSKEAALVRTIPPGQYSAQVRGKPEVTGTGVVEIYFLQ